ncbi:unnamed protein product [Heligmosomoides polygyrus]|uniref:Uncharacterized protein n=1 Tax=Heligmosomoides polygyrus TaxID=6339 RepID=A0A183G3W0_HELPZ|nr:unnamed protein product [Heligmosomoides polygyrus]
MWPPLDKEPSREEIKLAERMASILKNLKACQFEVDEGEQLEVVEEQEGKNKSPFDGRNRKPSPELLFLTAAGCDPNATLPGDPRKCVGRPHPDDEESAASAGVAEHRPSALSELARLPSPPEWIVHYRLPAAFLHGQIMFLTTILFVTIAAHPVDAVK